MVLRHINKYKYSHLINVDFFGVCREKKREREREELWKRLHELADEIHTQKGDRIGLAPLTLSSGAGQQSNSDHTSSNNQNNMQGAVASSTQHSAGPTGISTQMNSMSISGTAAMSK